MSLAAAAGVFSNPNKALMYITVLNIITKDITVQLYSLSGALQCTQKLDFNLSQTLSVPRRSFLKSGMYLIQFTTPKGITSTQKIIVA